MHRIPLREIRDRTCKRRDAWWTVLLVDPVALRLVRLVYPYRWITPNLLSLFAFVLGLGAAAAFATGERWWLVAGAVLFHLAFVVDCMDGKIARLNGTGTTFGVWFDFIFDRVRVLLCAVALMGGQYARTGEVKYIWLCTAVIGLDLFRYLNGSQMGKIKTSMNAQLAAARGVVEAPEPVDDEGETEAEQRPAPPPPAAGDKGLYLRVRNYLLRGRIRTHLFSGIEYEMTVFIIGPIAGVFWTSVVAGVLLLAFETLLVVRLYQLARRFPERLRKAEVERAAREQAETGQGGVTPSPTRV